MLRQLINNKAKSPLEYMMLIAIIAGALFIFQFYISRAMQGRLKATGDSFAFGRQYDPNKTVECAYSQINAEFGMWYDATCYRHAISSCRPGEQDCEDKAKTACFDAFCCQEDIELPGKSNCGTNNTNAPQP